MNFFELYVEEDSDHSEPQIEDKVNKKEPKIVNKIIGCDIEKFFKGTKVYQGDSDTNFIKDININGTNEHKRIFYKFEGNKRYIGYLEIFQFPGFAFSFKISKRISFLFECTNEKNLSFNEKRCFGFRYYNNNNKYCTLLKIGDTELDNYEFLEKIKNSDNEFYNVELDCFSIVYESIFSKFKENSNEFNSIVKEGPIYEILGFCYALIFKSTECFKFHRPYIPDVTNIKDITQPLLNEIDENKLYAIPILYDGHISILFCFKKNGVKGFLLSDPSHYYTQKIEGKTRIDEYIFPKEIRKHLYLYPSQKIQKFNSNSLWFYFQMLILINYDKSIQKEYKTPKDVVKSFLDSTIYLECVKYYQKLFGITKNFININPSIDTLDLDYIYSIPKKEFYLLEKISINKNAFMNQFVDIIGICKLITNQDLSGLIGFREIQTFQNYYENYMDFISLLYYNYNFLEFNKSKDDYNAILKNLLETINGIESNTNNYIKHCIEYFDDLIEHKNYGNLFGQNPEENKEINRSQSQKLMIIEKDNTIFEKYKNKIESEIKLYSLDVTSKILFPIVGILYNSK